MAGDGARNHEFHDAAAGCVSGLPLVGGGKQYNHE